MRGMYFPVLPGFLLLIGIYLAAPFMLARGTNFLALGFRLVSGCAKWGWSACCGMISLMRVARASLHTHACLHQNPVQTRPSHPPSSSSLIPPFFYPPTTTYSPPPPFSLTTLVYLVTYTPTRQRPTQAAQTAKYGL